MKLRGAFLAISVLLALSPLLVTAPVRAATGSFYFSPSTIRLNAGQTATVSLYISTPDQAINAADGTIVLPDAQASGVSVSKSGSIFANWPEEPNISGASIRFAGGLPTPGYQGSSGKVLTITIRAKGEGTGLISLTGGRILANNSSSTNIYGGAGTSTVIVTRTVSGGAISSSTHPDQAKWYKAKDALLSWTKPSGVSGYSYTLSHDGGQASKSGTGPQTSASFNGLADGVWTFSLTTNYSDGKTASSSFIFRIDMTPPAEFSFKSESKNGSTDPFPTLSYTTTDTPSGIDHYEIIIGDDPPITTTDTSFKLPKQKPGKYNVIVRAFDKAGNSTDATGSISVEGFPGPVIKNFPKYVSIFQPIFLTGSALYGSKVQIYVDGEMLFEFAVKDHLSDKQKQSPSIAGVTDESSVEWVIELKNGKPPGKHLIYAIQTRPDGAESNRSNEVTVRVLSDSVSLFGYSFPMLLVALILLLIVAALSLIAIRLMRKLRKLGVGWKKRKKDIETKIQEEMKGLQSDLERRIQPSTVNPVDPNKIIEEEIEKTKRDITDTIEKDG